MASSPTLATILIQTEAPELALVHAWLDS